MTVLVWGDAGDPPVDAVVEALAERGCPFLRVDSAPVRFDLRFSSPSADDAEGVVVPGGSLPVKFSGMYLRPNLGAACEVPESFFKLRYLAEVTRVPVMNRPSAAASNHTKPYQQTALGRLGFEVPDTLITTSPDRALAFLAVTVHGVV